MDCALDEVGAAIGPRGFVELVVDGVQLGRSEVVALNTHQRNSGSGPVFCVLVNENTEHTVSLATCLAEPPM